MRKINQFETTRLFERIDKSNTDHGLVTFEEMRDLLEEQLDLDTE